MSGSSSKNPKSGPKAGWKREYDATFGDDKISTLVKRAKVALSDEDLGTFQAKLKAALVAYNTAKEDDDQFQAAVQCVADLHADSLLYWNVPEPAAPQGEAAGRAGQQPGQVAEVPRGPGAGDPAPREDRADGQEVPANAVADAPAGETSARPNNGIANLQQLRDQMSYTKWISMMQKVTYNDNGLAELLVNFLFEVIARVHADRSRESDDSLKQRRMLDEWDALASGFVSMLEDMAVQGYPLWTTYRDLALRDDLRSKLREPGSLSAAEKARELKEQFAAAAAEQKKSLVAEAKRKDEAAAKARAQPAQTTGGSKNRTQCFACRKWGHTAEQCRAPSAPQQTQTPAGGGGRGRGNHGNSYGAFGGGSGGGYGHHNARQGQWQYGYPQWPSQQ